MNRAQFKAAIKPYGINLRYSTGDSLGTKLHPAYLDVFLATDDIPALELACAVLGVRCAGVAVVPYQGSHRRICLRAETRGAV